MYLFLTKRSIISWGDNYGIDGYSYITDDDILKCKEMGLENIIDNPELLFFFMIDDLLVFFISMKTLELKAISNKYSKYSSLVFVSSSNL